MVEPDPILLQRKRIARQVSLAMRAGYGCFVLACILFVYAFATRWTPTLTMSITLILIIGSILLAPAIVFNYAIKAANRADRENSW